MENFPDSVLDILIQVSLLIIFHCSSLSLVILVLLLAQDKEVICCSLLSIALYFSTLQCLQPWSYRKWKYTVFKYLEGTDLEFSFCSSMVYNMDMFIKKLYSTFCCCYCYYFTISHYWVGSSLHNLTWPTYYVTTFSS